MQTNNIILRSKIIQEIRSFFHLQQFIEVQTPIRIPCPALEDYIDAIPAGNSFQEKYFLRTSPELHLKKLIANSNGLIDKVFQIGSCFRFGERGSKHNEEFTMLEWYQTHHDYLHILQLTEKLFKFICEKLDIKNLTFNNQTVHIFQNWEVISVKDAFLKYANADSMQCVIDGSFDEILTEKVEPMLGKNVPTVLINYPAPLAALSKISDNDPTVCERWELYIGGLELANCYTELTDVREQRQRFENTATLRANENREVYPIDEEFMQALEFLPNCAGIALGIDRLCMVFANTKNINEVTFQ